MGTTSSVNLGLANLVQDLTNIGSPLVSSPTAMAALEKASPSDIVQLSAEASQLQGMSVLFGESNTATTNPTAADSILSAMYPNSGSTTPSTSALDQALADASSGSSTGASSSTPSTTSSSSTASTPSLAQALATYQSNLQSDEIQSMFGE